MILVFQVVEFMRAPSFPIPITTQCDMISPQIYTTGMTTRTQMNTTKDLNEL